MNKGFTTPSGGTIQYCTTDCTSLCSFTHWGGIYMISNNCLQLQQPPGMVLIDRFYVCAHSSFSSGCLPKFIYLSKSSNNHCPNCGHIPSRCLGLHFSPKNRKTWKKLPCQEWLIFDQIFVIPPTFDKHSNIQKHCISRTSPHNSSDNVGKKHYTIRLCQTGTCTCKSGQYSTRQRSNNNSLRR